MKLKIPLSVCLFTNALFVAFFPNDISQVGIAFTGVILSLWLSCLVSNRLWRSGVFIALGVLFVQAGVWIRDCAWQGGLQIMGEKPVGIWIGDFLYGFRHIPLNLIALWTGCYNALFKNQSGAVDNLNYRFICTGLLLIICMIPLLRHKTKNNREAKLQKAMA